MFVDDNSWPSKICTIGNASAVPNRIEMGPLN